MAKGTQENISRLRLCLRWKTVICPDTSAIIALAAGAFCWMQFNPFRDPDVVACTHGVAPLLVLPFCLLAVVSGIACF